MTFAYEPIPLRERVGNWFNLCWILGHMWGPWSLPISGWKHRQCSWCFQRQDRQVK